MIRPHLQGWTPAALLIVLLSGCNSMPSLWDSPSESLSAMTDRLSGSDSGRPADGPAAPSDPFRDSTPNTVRGADGIYHQVPTNDELRQMAANPSNARQAADTEANLDAELALARFCEQRGTPTDAERVYRSYLEKHPKSTHPLPYHRLGVLCARQGKFPEADRYFLKAVSLAPNDTVLLGDFGYFYYLVDRLDLAEKVLGRALQIAPGDPQVTQKLALVLGARGRYDESLRLFKQSLPEAEAYSNLAYIHLIRGEMQLAKQAFNRALSLDPSLRPTAEAAVRLAEKEGRVMEVVARREAAQKAAQGTTPDGARPTGMERPAPRSIAETPRMPAPPARQPVDPRPSYARNETETLPANEAAPAQKPPVVADAEQAAPTESTDPIPEATPVEAVAESSPPERPEASPTEERPSEHETAEHSIRTNYQNAADAMLERIRREAASAPTNNVAETTPPTTPESEQPKGLESPGGMREAFGRPRGSAALLERYGLSDPTQPPKSPAATNPQPNIQPPRSPGMDDLTPPKPYSPPNIVQTPKPYSPPPNIVQTRKPYSPPPSNIVRSETIGPRNPPNGYAPPPAMPARPEPTVADREPSRPIDSSVFRRPTPAPERPSPALPDDLVYSPFRRNSSVATPEHVAERPTPAGPSAPEYKPSNSRTLVMPKPSHPLMRDRTDDLAGYRPSTPAMSNLLSEDHDATTSTLGHARPEGRPEPAAQSPLFSAPSLPGSHGVDAGEPEAPASSEMLETTKPENSVAEQPEPKSTIESTVADNEPFMAKPYAPPVASTTASSPDRFTFRPKVAFPAPPTKPTSPEFNVVGANPFRTGTSTIPTPPTEVGADASTEAPTENAIVESESDAETPAADEEASSETAIAMGAETESNVDASPLGERHSLESFVQFGGVPSYSATSKPSTPNGRLNFEQFATRPTWSSPMDAAAPPIAAQAKPAYGAPSDEPITSPTFDDEDDGEMIWIRPKAPSAAPEKSEKKIVPEADSDSSQIGFMPGA